MNAKRDRETGTQFVTNLVLSDSNILFLQFLSPKISSAVSLYLGLVAKLDNMFLHESHEPDLNTLAISQILEKAFAIERSN
jgi:hypothetical protein